MVGFLRVSFQLLDVGRPAATRFRGLKLWPSVSAPGLPVNKGRFGVRRSAAYLTRALCRVILMGLEGLRNYLRTVMVTGATHKRELVGVHRETPRPLERPPTNKFVDGTQL